MNKKSNIRSVSFDTLTSEVQKKKIAELNREADRKLKVAEIRLREADRKLKEAEHRLSEADTAMQLAKESAYHEYTDRSEFLSNISHDIRIPLNGIIGMLNVAEIHKSEPERVLDCLGQIRNASNHLMMLINDMLDMSRAENGSIVLAHEPFDLVKLIKDCTNIIDSQVTERKITFISKTDGIRHRYLYGSPLHLRNIFLNILENAVKYTGEGGHIGLIIDEFDVENTAAAGFKILITDDGIGMSEEYQKHIFEPFARADNTRNDDMKRTGLGMAITKNLVELMGGSIEVESILNEGSTFMVTLTLDVDKDSENTEDIEETMTEGNSSIDGLKVLVVEDNELNREIAMTLLEDKGAVVTSAVDGRQALNLFRYSGQGTFDVILMDVRMPVMDGLEATRQIRALQRPDASVIPIIAMTANAFEEDVMSTKKAGMNVHLSKPLNIETLIETLSVYNKK